jgi:hypothetical protein
MQLFRYFVPSGHASSTGVLIKHDYEWKFLEKSAVALEEVVYMLERFCVESRER